MKASKCSEAQIAFFFKQDLWAYHKGVVLDFSRPGKPTDNSYIESFMYRRPRGRKRLSASSGHHSGAFMYSAFNCDPYNGRWP